MCKNRRFTFSVLTFSIFILGLFLSGTVFAAECGPGSSPLKATCACGDTVVGDYTLSANLTGCTGDGLVVGADSITINGGGFAITGNSSFGDSGISNLDGYDYVTVKNFANISGFGTGVYFVNSTYGTIANNVANSNSSGIGLAFSSDANITDNTVTLSTYGIFLTESTDNNIINNTANWNTNGIYLEFATDNNLVSNTANSNFYGIWLVDFSSSNVLNGNTANSNAYGILLDTSCPSNTLAGNTMADNGNNFLITGEDASFDNEIDTTNLAEGEPIYYLYSHSNETYDFSGDTIGAFWCILCSNVTLKNAVIAPNNYYAVYFKSTTNSSIVNVTGSLNTHGIYFSSSTDNNLIDNNFTLNSYGAYFDSSTDNNLISNTLYSNTSYGLYLLNSSPNVIQENLIAQNQTAFTDNGAALNTYLDNNFFHNTSNETITFTETERKKEPNDTVNFTISLKNVDGTACNDCEYSIAVSPLEQDSFSLSKTDNEVTGSFTATKKGLYSLTVDINDGGDNPNTTKRNYAFYVGADGNNTAKYYFRETLPARGQPKGTDGKSMLLQHPDTNAYWRCGGWVQNSPDETPDFPLASLSSVNMYTWYKSDVIGYMGIQRFVTWDITVDKQQSVSLASTYTWTGLVHLSDLNWAMEYPWNWYWLSLKLRGLYPRWITFPTMAQQNQPSYADFNYRHTTTPVIKSFSNNNILVLSATAPLTDTNNAALVLDGELDSLLSGTGDTNIVFGSDLNKFRRPFSGGYTTTISSDGNAILMATGITNTTDINSVAMDIFPSTGSISVVIDTWNASGNYYKKWAETGSSAEISATHIIGDLNANSAYLVKIDDTNFGFYLSNASGKISFVYDSGYSTKTFEIEAESTPPGNVELSYITADSSSQLTVVSGTAVDSGIGLSSTPYWFAETSGSTGGSSSTGWQSDVNFVDSGLASNTQYSYKVKARDASGNESDYSATLSKYTLAPTPTNFTATSASSTTTSLSVDSLNSATSNSSGYYFYRADAPVAHNSGWIQTNSWQDTGTFACGEQYVYYAKYRNGDGVETSAVSASTSLSCGALSSFRKPVPPPPTIENPAGNFMVLINSGAAETDSHVVNLTFFAGADTKYMLVSEDKDFASVEKELYAQNKNYVLSEGDGNKTVYAKFFNVYWVSSDVVSASIIVKSQKPGQQGGQPQEQEKKEQANESPANSRQPGKEQLKPAQNGIASAILDFIMSAFQWFLGILKLFGLHA